MLCGCDQVVVLAVDSVHARRKSKGVDIDSLLKLKLKLEPIRLQIDGGLLRRCNEFFHDSNPRPQVHPRPDDARFQLVEMDGLRVMVDYVRTVLAHYSSCSCRTCWLRLLVVSLGSSATF